MHGYSIAQAFSWHSKFKYVIYGKINLIYDIITFKIYLKVYQIIIRYAFLINSREAGDV